MVKKTKHNQKVEQIANELEKNGWYVQVDLPGWDKPNGIGKNQRIPDIKATKSGAERLIEVETKISITRDKPQHQTFRRRAGQKKRTTFRIEEV